MKLIVGHRACGILYRYIKHVGGKWLLPANVCPVVPFTFVEAKVPFEFVDIDINTLCISEEDVIDKILNDQMISGILYVHTYGSEQDANGLVGRVRALKSDMKIVDDRCLCRPDTAPISTSADMVLYSTGYAKYVDLGKCGFAWMQDGEDYDRMDCIYEQDNLEEYYKHLQASNMHYSPNTVPIRWLDTALEKDEDAIQKYLDTIKMQLPIMENHKKEINDIYGAISTLTTLGSSMNNWRYTLLSERKDEILTKIFAEGLFASSHYCPSSRLFTSEYYPNSEWLYSRVINLFNDKYISVDQAKRLTEILDGIV